MARKPRVSLGVYDVLIESHERMCLQVFVVTYVLSIGMVRKVLIVPKPIIASHEDIQVQEL